MDHPVLATTVGFLFLVLLVLVVFYFPQVMVLISGLAVTLIVLLGSYLIGAIFIDAFFGT
ncbi:hypothetical protein bcgnr5382_56840 [Bacillus cereus]